MASNESVTMKSSSIMQVDDEYDIDDLFDHPHQPHPHRLSMCTASSGDVGYFPPDDEDISDGGVHSIGIYMSRLSIESFHGDPDAYADQVFSDDEKEGKQFSWGLSSDSDKELLEECYSLPATPQRWMDRSGCLNQMKEYASENDAQKDFTLRGRAKMRRNTLVPRRRGRGRIARERATVLGDQDREMVNKEEADELDTMSNRNSYINRSFGGSSFSGGDSEVGGGGGGGLVVITRPKGGTRSLCMDLDEVKACRDLGFELEHGRAPLEITPSRLSMSASTLDYTSSGGTSPIPNWRISSPGDDPRDVKARLRVWAQAVALASTSHRHGC